MKVEVLDINGQATGRAIELPEDVFGIEPNDHAIYLDVKRYLAAQRQGTHKAKERNEIVGSTRKIKRQKGTGTARAGSIKSPIFRGGGRIFGPKPHKYKLKVNQKVRELARCSALTYKAQSNSIIIVEEFDFDGPKTKQYKSILTNLGVADKKTLLVLEEGRKNVYLSARNIPGAAVVTRSSLNTYTLLNNNSLILSETAAKQLAGA